MKRHILLLLATWVLFAACQNTVDCLNALAFKANDGDKWGVIATDGKILVQTNTFEEQPSAVVNEMFSMPNHEGLYQLYHIKHPFQPVNQRCFARIGHFYEEVTLAQETLQSPIIIINKKGETVFSTEHYPQYNIVLAHNFKEGRALIATHEGKYGYMDTQGKIIIPPIYDCAYDFNEESALVGMTNQQGATAYQLISPSGRVQLSIQLNNSSLSRYFCNGLLLFKNLNTNQCCYMDREGVPLICLPKEIKEAYPFKHELAVFQTTTGTGVIDSMGEIMIPAHYENAFIAGDGRIALKAKGYWAMAKNNGKQLCDFQYEWLGHYGHNNLAIACKKGRYLFIDTQGTAINNQTYAYIAKEEADKMNAPQLFIRKDNNDASKLSTEKNDQEEIASNRQTAATIQQIAPKTEVPSHHKIYPNRWKEISKQNPFYEEANKVLSGKLEEKDAKRRQQVLNYVEHLRTSYTTKDIHFLEQLFSENALIIVGTVIRIGSEIGSGYLSPSQVIYNVKSKQQYIDRLKQVFNANKRINVKFSDFRIMKHPTQDGIYGVSLRQGYSSDIYSDDGYLFLLWDFRDEMAPKIHVRTWQPSLLDNQTPLPEDAVFTIRNFNLQ